MAKTKTPSGGDGRDSHHRARLSFVDADALTITRRKRGKAWHYFDERGARITDKEEVARLNAIALPPAYGDARYCPDAHGHLQAVGTDARGRRQYRYHADYRAAQEAAKYSRCVEFAAILPSLRKAVEKDLKKPPKSREAVIAAIIQILDKTHMRIGNEAYCKSNKSYGATTLRTRHARLKGNALYLRYRGKAGIEREVRLTDRQLSRIVRRCQDLPGQRLFQYIDEADEVRPVSSGDVNAYIREASGADFTAKHFRTWHASVIAHSCLYAGEPLVETLAKVADALGNTPAIARKSYIHPALIEAIKNKAVPVGKPPRASKWLSREERAFADWIASQPWG